MNADDEWLPSGAPPCDCGKCLICEVENMRMKRDVDHDAAEAWIMARLKSGPAYDLPLALGVAAVIGLWDKKDEVFTDAQRVYDTTDAAIDRLVAAGRVTVEPHATQGRTISRVDVTA